jgi:hypothetical protein
VSVTIIPGILYLCTWARTVSYARLRGRPNFTSVLCFTSNHLFADYMYISFANLPCRFLPSQLAEQTANRTRLRTGVVTRWLQVVYSISSEDLCTAPCYPVLPVCHWILAKGQLHIRASSSHYLAERGLVKTRLPLRLA